MSVIAIFDSNRRDCRQTTRGETCLALARGKKRLSELMSSRLSLLHTPRWNCGGTCRKMTKARGGNCGIIRPLRLTSDDRLAWDCFVRVASENGGEVRLRRLNGETSPAEVKLSLDLELKTEVAVLDAFAVVEPRAIPALRAAAAIIEISHFHTDRLSEAIASLDFRSARQR